MPSTDLKCVLFDVGGVLIRDEGLKKRAAQAFQGVAPERLWVGLNAALLPACRGEATLLSCWQRLADELAVQAKPEVLAELWTADDFVNGIELNREVIHLAHSLRQGYKVGIVSNTMAEHAMALRLMGIYEGFDVVILSHELGRTKDNAEIFEIALSRLEVDAREAVFIDDFAPYTDVARSVGMAAIVFTDAASLVESLQSLGVGGTYPR